MIRFSLARILIDLFRYSNGRYVDAAYTRFRWKIKKKKRKKFLCRTNKTMVIQKESSLLVILSRWLTPTSVVLRTISMLLYFGIIP